MAAFAFGVAGVADAAAIITSPVQVGTIEKPTDAKTVSGETELTFTVLGLGEDVKVEKLELDIYKDVEDWNYEDDRYIDLTVKVSDLEDESFSNVLESYTTNYGLKSVSFDEDNDEDNNSVWVWTVVLDFDHEFWKAGSYDFLTAIHLSKGKIGENNYNKAKGEYENDVLFFTLEVEKSSVDEDEEEDNTPPRRRRSPRPVVDEDEEETEEAEEGEGAVFEFDGEEYNLDTMTVEEKEDLANNIRAKLIALIFELITKLQEQVAAAQS